MKLDFKDIIDKHKNIPCIVIAHGPSLNNISDKLPEYKNKGYILAIEKSFGTGKLECTPSEIPIRKKLTKK